MAIEPTPCEAPASTPGSPDNMEKAGERRLEAVARLEAARR
jgi:hypothetical protein